MTLIYDKYNMTVDENIFVAKRNIIDYIYKSARLEGFGVTFPDTEAIINGGIVQGLSVDEVVAVNNLKHAWQFILENIDYPTGYPLICEINRIVGANLFYNAGMARNIPVSIGGTNWKPPIPFESDVKDEIKDIFSVQNSTERSITLMLKLMRRQIFIDGNKRTAMLTANHHMIRSGSGIISIPVEHIPEFTQRLVEYYETDSINNIKQFIFDKAIDGLDMEKARQCKASENAFEAWKAKLDEERES